MSRKRMRAQFAPAYPTVRELAQVTPESNLESKTWQRGFDCI